ncbi:MAG: tyrosine-protein phosphatase [Bacteroidales bacterium]|nr:tyrosine-protein phosphatase [Bacteroidales bacterium]
MQHLSFERQSIQMQGIANARDLGGYVMADGSVIKSGLLLRTGCLGTATDADIQRLEDVYHVVHVFDFRTKSELQRHPDRELRSADNIHLPSNDPATEGEWRASALSDVARNNDMELLLRSAQTEEVKRTLSAMYPALIMSEWTQLQFATFLNYVAKTEDGAVLWHCSQGKDRTGWGAAFVLAALGASRDLIIADFDMSNVFYRAEVERLSSRLREMGGDEEAVEVIRGFIGVSTRNFIHSLNLIDKEFGSMHDYLVNQLCLSEEELEKMKNRYLIRS